MEELFNDIIEAWKARNEESFIAKTLLWFAEPRENPFAEGSSARKIFFDAELYHLKWRANRIDSRRARVLFIRSIKELFKLDLSDYCKKEGQVVQELEKTNEATEETIQKVKQAAEEKTEEVKTETEESKEPVEKLQEQIHVFGVVPENTAEIEENFAEKSPETKREESVNNKPQSYNPNAKPPFFGKRKR